MEEQLIVPDLKQVYLGCARRAIANLQKIEVILHKLRRANRRQKDLMHKDLEQLYSDIRKEVEYVLKIRRNQTEANIEAFDKFICEKAKLLVSDEPEVYFAKRIAEAIVESQAIKGFGKGR